MSVSQVGRHQPMNSPRSKAITPSRNANDSEPASNQKDAVSPGKRARIVSPNFPLNHDGTPSMILDRPAKPQTIRNRKLIASSAPMRDNEADENVIWGRILAMLCGDGQPI